MSTEDNKQNKIKIKKTITKKSEKKTPDGGSKPPQDPNQNKKIILNLLTVVFAFVVLLSILFLNSQLDPNKDAAETRTYSDLITDIRDGKVSKIVLSENKDEFKVELYENAENKDRSQIETAVYPTIGVENGTSALENLQNSLGGDGFKIGSADGQVIYEEAKKGAFMELVDSGYLWYLLMIIVFIAAIGIFLRRITESNNRAISFADSKDKLYNSEEGVKITFDDVAGNEEAKAELNEVVDFLKRPEEYAKMGAKIPKGVLLIGSPGNGKTLMAKAVAGEAKVPFFYVSGSEFVEMFVGVGAGRVRSLFKKAKKKGSAVIFIDEIDAVGRQRGAGLGGGNDEREQTLNQILVEMDGFEANTSIIVIGATNRPDVLDPALLRPGRFDRQVTVTAPDRRERLKILEVHAKDKALASDVDLNIVAKRTPGFSGADLMNVLNEAAILAVRENKKSISNDEVREAVEKVAFGTSLKSKLVTEEQKVLTAYHEAGHALTATVLPNAQKVQKISIIPRGRAAGYTFNVDDENDPMTRRKSEFLDEIVVLLGGYTVEQEIFGEVSTGASNDLSRATEIARKMVMKYGMGVLGPVSFHEDQGMAFLGRDMVEKQHYSEEIAKNIDLETREIIQECFKKCRGIIQKYKKQLVQISEKLLEEEVIEYEQFTDIVKDIIVKKEKFLPKV